MANFDPADPDDWKGLGLVVFIGFAVYATRLYFGPT